MNVSQEEITRWIDDLNESGKPIIVEGHNDRKALQKIGVKNEIFVFYSQPVHKLVEFIVNNHREIVLLVDLDKKGKQIYGRLNSEFSRFGVNVDKKFREFLQKRTELDQIEGIDSYFERVIEANSLS